MSPGHDTFDYETFLERAGGDATLASELVSLLLKTMPDMIDSIRQAAVAGDCRALEQSAHALKGCVANFTMGPAYQAAECLEKAGRVQEMEDAALQVGDLEKAVEQLRLALVQSPAGARPQN